MENERGIYFSEYMRQPQIDLLHFIGYKDAQIAWTTGYKPNSIRTHKSQEFEYSFATNELGLRGKLPNLHKDSNEYRIVVLGDSFIEGFGTLDDSTFCVLLQNQLQIKYPTKKISVINGGLCGSSPIFEIELYNNKLANYKADLVILATNLTDLSDVKFQLHQGKMSASEYLYAISHLFRYFYIGILDYNFNIENINNKFKEERKYNTKYIIDNILNFNKILLKNKQQLVVLYIPLLFEFKFDKTQKQPCISYINALQESNISMVPMFNYYKKNKLITQENMYQYYWEYDHHYTNLGYYLMANVACNYIIAN